MTKSLELKRIFLGREATIGELYIDGVYLCDTLEDKVRPDGVKIMGETAIPGGIYDVKLTHSPKFKRVLPEILNVPGFTAIRIHSGNTVKDTEGCILVGHWEGLNPEWISDSKKALEELLKALHGTEEIKITIS
jgi:hypothetical protein